MPLQQLVACGHCSKGIQDDGTFSGHFYTYEGRQIHEECFEEFVTKNADKCTLCAGPLCEVPGKYSEKFAVLEDERRVHMECLKEFQAVETESMKASKTLLCQVCDQPCKTFDADNVTGNKYVSFENGDVVHEACREAYLETSGSKCAQCSKAIGKYGEFNGRFYDIEGSSDKVHFECIGVYRNGQAGSCAQCGLPCYKHAQFSGEYILFGSEKCHAECLDDYEEAHAEKCHICQEGIRPTSKYSGEYYALGEDRKVHVECHEG